LRPSAPLSEAELSSLDTRFQQTKWLVGTSMIAIAAAFAWSTHAVLVSLNRYLASSDGPQTILRLWPESAIWCFFPGL
jgi:hypothetical protein